MINKKAEQTIILMLETADEFYIPVKKLWKELKAQGYDLPELEKFEMELEKDERLEFINPPKDELDDELEEEMEKLGFYSGPRVKLKSRKITKEDFIRILSKHTQNITDNLVSAYQVKPPDLPEEQEDELIELMKLSKKLKDGINDAMG